MEEWRDSSALDVCSGKHLVLEEEKQMEKLNSEQRQIPERKPSGSCHGCGWKSRGKQQHNLSADEPSTSQVPAQSPQYVNPLPPQLPAKTGRPRSPLHWETTLCSVSCLFSHYQQNNPSLPQALLTL